MKDGSRKVTNISEITGMEGDTITMQDIFTYEQHGLDEAGRVQGVFRPTGIRPNIIDKLFDLGIPIPGELARLFPNRAERKH
jgi:pilus assembly protein CpaF